MKNKNKVIILASIIVGVLVVTLGLTYAVLSFNETKGNSKLVLGDIWMHYGETNQLVLNDAMPMDINDYITYKVNPVMANQEVVDNELSRCVNYLSGLGYANGLDSGSTMITYCQGNGTAYGGYTLQNDIDDNIFNEVQLQAMLSLNVIVANGDNYIVNPIMADQEYNELSKCIEIYTNWKYEFDEESDAKSFCQGTGNQINGLTIQEDLNMLVKYGKLVSGEYFVDFISGDGQELLNANVILPQIENLPYFEFTIDGKNTYTKKDIWYEIVLNHGDKPETRSTRIRDNLLRFALVEVLDGNEKVLFSNRNYNNLVNRKIYVDTIPASTNEEINKTYRLYMWISKDTVIGNYNQDYTLDEWNDVYASIKVNVTGDFNEKIVTTDAACFETEETVVYTLNPIMETQTFTEIEEVNELTKCMLEFDYYDLDEGSTVESFCKGTGTYYDKTFQQRLDEGYYSDYTLETYLDKNIIILENDTYKVNEVMQSQSFYLGKDELTACVTYFTDIWGPEDESWKLKEGETYSEYCKGTGTIDGEFINYELYEEQYNGISSSLNTLEKANIVVKEEGLSVIEYDNTCSDEVIIPNTIDGMNVIKIGAGAFFNSNIKNIKFNSNVKYIDRNAFGTIPTTVILPSSVVYLDCDAFGYSTNIKIEKALKCVRHLD